MENRKFDPSRSRFIISLPKWRDLPELNRPIIVVGGRSNVGKSSFINMILGRKGLARTSNTPGRTQLLNFFDIDDKFVLADVPGYGFAKAPPEVVKKWTENVRDFVRDADNVCAVLQLLDIRRAPSLDDLFFSDLVRKHRKLVVPVVTKSDKLKRSQHAKQLKVIATEMAVAPSSLILTSAKDRVGRDGVWSLLNKILRGEHPGDEG